MIGQTSKDQNVLKVFRKEKIVTNKRLTQLLEASNRTVQRRLRQWQTHTSYNKNGRYYALPDIPEFDKHGLWKYRGVCFSEYGNLCQTIATLVNKSPNGLTVGEASKLVSISLRNVYGRKP